VHVGLNYLGILRIGRSSLSCNAVVIGDSPDIHNTGPRIPEGCIHEHIGGRRR